MRGLLGKKLGMTQVFDEESGVVTSVTVIEAGPCPVVAVRTPDVDGYEAGQRAREPVADRKGPKTHGSHNIRKPGSIGASATPSRVFKGIRMAGLMGAHRVTQVGLTVHAIDADRNLLLIKGAVPGPKNALVEIREESR